MKLLITHAEAVEIRPESDRINLEIEGVSPEDILPQIPLSEVISFFGEAEILDHIGEAEVAKHFDDGRDEEW